MASIPFPKSLVCAWRDWLRIPAPVANARARQRSAPAYRVEVELDRVASHACSLVQGALARQPWDYSALAADGLEELHHVAVQLDRCDLTHAQRAPCERYCGKSRGWGNDRYAVRDTRTASGSVCLLGPIVILSAAKDLLSRGRC